MERALPPLILLAAGSSRRTGSPKGLFRLADAFWIEAQLAAYAAAGGTQATVVLGFHAEAFFKSCPWLGAGEFEGLPVVTVHNPDPDRGPFTSLQTALAVTVAPCFILPIDVPAPQTAVWQALAISLHHSAATQPTFEGRGGHPVLVGRAFADHLRGLPADARLDEQLRSLPPPQRLRLPVDDERVVRNLNTPEDWATFLNLSIGNIEIKSSDQKKIANRP